MQNCSEDVGIRWLARDEGRKTCLSGGRKRRRVVDILPDNGSGNSITITPLLTLILRNEICMRLTFITLRASLFLYKTG